ncbi:MAG: hypothetical protein V4857_22310, partial [Pseudomonadota bacterium]
MRVAQADARRVYRAVPAAAVDLVAEFVPDALAVGMRAKSRLELAPKTLQKSLRRKLNIKNQHRPRVCGEA